MYVCVTECIWNYRRDREKWSLGHGVRLKKHMKKNELKKFSGKKGKWWEVTFQLNNKNTSYLKECNEEEKGIGCPPELWVQESREEGEDIIFCCAEDQIK